MSDEELRVAAFIEQRDTMRGLDPDEITAANWSPLLKSDLLALLDRVQTAEAREAALRASVEALATEMGSAYTFEQWDDLCVRLRALTTPADQSERGAVVCICDQTTARLLTCPAHPQSAVRVVDCRQHSAPHRGVTADQSDTAAGGSDV